MTVTVLFLTLFALLIVGVPIAFALGGSVVIASLLFSPMPIVMFGQKIYANLDAFPLMAVPFFFLAAAYMEKGNIVHHLIGVADAFVGHRRGGLGMTAVIACMFFATISGSSAATVAAVGGVMYPGLVRAGYSKDYAVGAVATAGALGVLIPPSIPLILYGLITETSIPKLFIAGVLPGLVYGSLLTLLANWLAVREHYEPAPRMRWRKRWTTFYNALPALGLPVLLIVGIYGFPAFTVLGVHYSGGAIFTPTEAALMLVLFALVVGFLFYRQLRLRDVFGTIIEITPRIGMIFWIVTNAILFGFFLTQLQVPAELARWLVNMHVAKWEFLLFTNIMLIVAGMFMDGIPIILMFVPVLFPAAVALGVDPIHFGIMIVVNIELGTLTPPVGVNLFVASMISDLPLLRVARACLPWIAVNVLMLLIVAYVPVLSTFLPGLMR
ncbi:MAG: TRAP transporter large permease subunit [Burkholderiales bacterium]|nr:TRAP transporter large permease subunit [Burkholderiales bacterium]